MYNFSMVAATPHTKQYFSKIRRDEKKVMYFILAMSLFVSCLLSHTKDNSSSEPISLSDNGEDASYSQSLSFILVSVSKLNRCRLY